MPTYNPLIGWTQDDGSLMGWNGQERTGGMSAGMDNGFNGEVHNLPDFLSAIGMGFGTVAGGPIGAALGIGNMLVGANTGTSPSTLNTARTALQGLGLMDISPTTGPVTNDLTTPSFGGKTGEISDSATGGSVAGPVGGVSNDVSSADFGGKSGEISDSVNTDPRGFAMGGFTGGAEGQPRGEVHGQELVLSAPAVRALGPVANELATVNALATPQQAKPGSWAEMIQMHHPEAWG